MTAILEALRSIQMPSLASILGTTAQTIGLVFGKQTNQLNDWMARRTTGIVLSCPTMCLTVDYCATNVFFIDCFRAQDIPLDSW